MLERRLIEGTIKILIKNRKEKEISNLINLTTLTHLWTNKKLGKNSKNSKNCWRR